MSTIESHFVDFEGLRIEYDDQMLTPWRWTAAQSRWAAELMRMGPPGRVLELCSGAGHIGLLAIRLAPRRLVCVDRDPIECGYLRRNAALAGQDVEVREGRMDDVLEPDEEFAVIIVDPPWVRSADAAGHPGYSVPAVDGDVDGLALAERCLDVVDRHLMVAGSALLQVGPDQTDALADLVSVYDELTVVAQRELEHGTLVQIDRMEYAAA